MPSSLSGTLKAKEAMRRLRLSMAEVAPASPASPLPEPSALVRPRAVMSEVWRDWIVLAARTSASAEDILVWSTSPEEPAAARVAAPTRSPLAAAALSLVAERSAVFSKVLAWERVVPLFLPLGRTTCVLLTSASASFASASATSAKPETTIEVPPARSFCFCVESPEAEVRSWRSLAFCESFSTSRAAAWARRTAAAALLAASIFQLAPALRPADSGSRRILTLLRVSASALATRCA
mmetsp:Transcript_21442/g.67330  ORF Transcript_21442/g.67330 Transcript_21442/m.67330 type:complete len:238 (+) Transcript_21442:512-1225(+)